MKFQNPSIHRSKVSNFTEKWKNQTKFKNSVFLSKFDGKFSKVKLTDVHTHTQTDRQTDRQAKSNMPFQLFQSWGHNNIIKSNLPKRRKTLFT